jgi:arylsulfatase A-like enzyme
VDRRARTPPHRHSWSRGVRRTGGRHQAQHCDDRGRRHAHRRPALDARVRELVEEQGLDFRNSFSSNPLCAPARSSLLSGQYSHNTGVVSVEPPRNYSTSTTAPAWDGPEPRGYNTLFLGKYLNGYGNGRSRVTQENSFRYVPPGWTDWYGSVQPPRDSEIKGGTYQYYHLLLNHNGR